MRLSRTDRLLLPLALLAGAGLVALAFHLAGFLGIACLGLAILFLAIHLEVEKAGAPSAAPTPPASTPSRSPRRTAKAAPTRSPAARRSRDACACWRRRNWWGSG